MPSQATDGLSRWRPHLFALVAALALAGVTRPVPIGSVACYSLVPALLLVGLALLALVHSGRRGWEAALPPLATRASRRLITLGLAGLASVLLLMALVRLPVVAAVDERLCLAFSRGAPPGWDRGAEWLRDAGGRGAMLLVSLLVVLALLVRRRAQAVPFYMITVAATPPLEVFLKTLSWRGRPEIEGLHFNSFPSGHAQAAAVLAGVLLCLFAPALAPRRRGWLYLAAGLWVIAVGGSRVILERHFPLDVVGGILAGAAWVCLCRGVHGLAVPRAIPARPRGAVIQRRLALSLLVGLGVLLGVGPWPVDRRSFAGTGYERSTLTRLDTTGPALAAAQSPGPLEVGYARRDITPRAGEALAGYSKRWGLGCTGAYDRLRVSALALRAGGLPTLIVTADLLLFNEALAERVHRSLRGRVSRGQLYFSASHTHSGPGGYGANLVESVTLGREDPAVLKRLVTATTEVATEALETLSPASWTYRSAHHPEEVRNRVNRTWPVDDELSVLAFRRAADELRVVVWPAHPTLVKQTDLRASADYPGALVTELEARPGVKAMFLAGAMGSCTYVGHGFGRGHAGAQAYGRRLARKVEATLSGAPYRTQATLASVAVPVDFGVPQVRIGRHLRFSPLVTSAVLGPRTPTIQVITIGDVVLLGTPGDLNGELSLQVKEHARGRGYHPVTTSFAGSYVGYLLPPSYYDVDHYEAKDMALFGPHGGAYVASLLMAATDLLTRSSVRAAADPRRVPAAPKTRGPDADER